MKIKFKDKNFASEDNNFAVDTPETQKEKFSFIKTRWFMVISLVWLPPLGIFLMWYYRKCSIAVKWFFSAVFVFYNMIYFGMLFS